MEQPSFSGVTGVATDRQALLVGGTAADWNELCAALAPEGIVFERVALEDAGAAARRHATLDNTVAVIHLDGEPARGMAAVMAVRQAVPRLPVVVVARNPSVELVRRARLARVFYLALDPVTVDEMRSILQEAWHAVALGLTGASRVRSRPRILMIDDDADFRASLKTLLESHGYAVSTARDGREGLARVREDSPDLILLDVMMENDWAGYEVNQALKFSSEFERVRAVPIVMLSSVPIDPATRFMMSAQADMVTADAYLTKPVDIPRLLDTVRSFTGGPVEDAPQHGG